ncbi:hypothetical protein [Methylocystis parvus]|uniref:hypothetical protein n=1 Tax=Methylocystis parvus TaxID=134 RepID=UPI003C784B73
MQPIGQKWWPEHFLDEVMPPGRDHPTAWIETIGGRACIAAPDDDREPRELKDGDLVRFQRCDDYGVIDLHLRPDGYSLSQDPPKEAEQCCVLDGWNVETVAIDVAEMVESLRDAGADPETYRAAFYTFVDTGDWRYCAATNAFEQVQS